MTIQEEIKKRRTFAIISHRTRGRQPSLSSCSTLGGRDSWGWYGKRKKQGLLPSLTGWILRNNVDFGHVICYAVWLWWQAREYPRHTRARGLLRRYLSDLDGGGCCGHGRGLCQGYRGQTRNCLRLWSTVAFQFFTFMNKLDRDGREPLDLLQELEEVLALRVINELANRDGESLQGLYDLYNQRLELYKGDERFCQSGRRG